MLELNNQIVAELDIGTSSTPQWATLGTSFKNISIALGENVYTASYLADEGFSSSEVTGLSPTATFTGDFKPDDPLCVFLNERQYTLGESRKSKLRLTRNGEVLIAPVTMTAITLAGGEANQPNSVTLTLAFNGKPEISVANG